MEAKPFSRERFVRWGDCDPAGIIYAPRVYEYAIDTLEEFYKEVLGHSWMDLKDKSVVGTPILRSEIEYMRPLVPDQKIVVEINIKKVGTKTVTYEMNGLGHSGDQFFRVQVTMCFISQPDFKSSDIPDDIRKRLVDYGF
ncbi:MAG: acyl-CoA thioesterase [Desulfobacterales bacterium]|nr:acyl-CoA thioesterase [Desulfobacterales bacterium]